MLACHIARLPSGSSMMPASPWGIICWASSAHTLRTLDSLRSPGSACAQVPLKLAWALTIHKCQAGAPLPWLPAGALPCSGRRACPSCSSGAAEQPGQGPAVRRRRSWGLGSRGLGHLQPCRRVTSTAPGCSVVPPSALGRASCAGQLGQARGQVLHGQSATPRSLGGDAGHDGGPGQGQPGQHVRRGAGLCGAQPSALHPGPADHRLQPGLRQGRPPARLLCTAQHSRGLQLEALAASRPAHAACLPAVHSVLHPGPADHRHSVLHPGPAEHRLQPRLRQGRPHARLLCTVHPKGNRAPRTACLPSTAQRHQGLQMPGFSPMRASCCLPVCCARRAWASPSWLKPGCTPLLSAAHSALQPGTCPRSPAPASAASGQAPCHSAVCCARCTP